MHVLARRLAAALLLVLVASASAMAARSAALVYDDSKSMKDEDRWLYANFALQTLVALLDPEDRLDVVTMSEPGKAASLTDFAAKSKQIESLKRQRLPTANTPYEAVRTAMQSLRARKAESDERWLIVITDGGFGFKKGSAETRDSVSSEFAGFVRETGARTIFLLIGEKADRTLPELWQKAGQATVLRASSSDEIVDRMHEIASMLMAREGGGSELGRAQQGNDVLLSPRFPLRRVVLFAQSAGSHKLPRLASASSEVAELQTRGYLPEMPQATKSGRSSALVTHIQPARPPSMIPEGTDALRLTFQGTDGLRELHLFPEVAARLDVELRSGEGARITPDAEGVIAPCIGATVQIASRLTTDDGRTLTESQADTSAFKAGFTLGADAETPMALNAAKTEFLGSFVAQAGETTISASATFPGYFRFRSRIFTVHAKDCRPRAVDLDVDTTSWSGDVTRLDGSTAGLRGTAEGQAIGAEEFAMWQVAIVGEAPLGFDLEKDKKERIWRLRPNLSWMYPCLCPTGPQNLRLRLDTGRPAEAREIAVALPVEDASWWTKCGWLVVIVLVILTVVCWLFGVVTKPRFRAGSVVFHEHRGRRETIALPGRWWSRWIFPYRAERREVVGVRFIAPPRNRNHILLARDNQAEGMTIGGLPIDPLGQRDVPLADGERLEVPGNNHEAYTYSSHIH